MCFGWSWVFSSGRCCCCDLRVIQLNLYRASNRLLGFAPSDVTRWTFATLFGRRSANFPLKISTRSQKSRWWTTSLSHATLSSPPDRLIRLVGIDHGAVEKENKENGRRAEKLLLIDLFSCTFAWFKFRGLFFFFHPPSLSWLLAKITHAPPTAPIKLSRDNLPTLASYFARRDPWLSDFPCSSWFWIIFPWNLRRSAVSQIGARRSDVSATKFLAKCISPDTWLPFGEKIMNLFRLSSRGAER